ncbi:hypothetical protein LCL99_03070 [Halomonas denitrificans]|uniref:hypothetical protein n=1 Tax=Halomonas TaxID=2745 RepID=UPI001C96CFDD|nr:MULTISPECIES: hypothetical protein [Halomonas]MBY6030021.1 hypothetical protein [Halomonas sp. DP8Y7-1]MCA0973446.1 hypothetical protein [Halomonas denitrificans]
MEQHQWKTTEKRYVKRRLDEGATYQDIATELGLGRDQVCGLARRSGFTDPIRQGAWRRRDWTDIDRTVQDCIEVQCMSIRQVVSYLRLQGISTCYSSINNRVKLMPASVQFQASINAARRQASNAYRMRLRIKRAA